MNKAAAIDQILAKFLKEGAEILTVPLSRLINLSHLPHFYFPATLNDQGNRKTSL